MEDGSRAPGASGDRDVTAYIHTGAETTKTPQLPTQMVQLESKTSLQSARRLLLGPIKISGATFYSNKQQIKKMNIRELAGRSQARFLVL